MRGYIRTGRMDASYKFLHDSAYISIADQCKSELAAWYLQREFDKKVAA